MLKLVPAAEIPLDQDQLLHTSSPAAIVALCGEVAIPLKVIVVLLPSTHMSLYMLVPAHHMSAHTFTCACLHSDMCMRMALFLQGSGGGGGGGDGWNWGRTVRNVAPNLGVLPTPLPALDTA